MNRVQGIRREAAALLAAAAVSMFGITGSATVASAQQVPNAAGGAPSVPFVRAEGSIFNPTASKNFFSPNFPFGAADYVILPLALQTPQSLASYIPQVATSWRWKGNKLIVQIRKMHWQDGSPLTVRDVVDSEILNGVESGGVWDDVSWVGAGGGRSVVFTALPGVARTSAESTILGSTVLPASQYGQFVTPGLEKTVASYYAALLKSPTSAPDTPEGKTVAADSAKVLKYSPTTMIGDGPYVWKSWTTNELELVKSPTFYGAKNVHVQVFEDKQEGPNINGALLTGLSDYTTSGLPTQVVEKNMTIPGHHVYFPPAYDQQGIEFNCRRYPLDNVKVRQALVYILHRPDLIHLIYGHLKSYTFVRHPSLLPADELRYITKSQLDSLNAYPFSLSKATSLLESAGFHKSGGRWIMPDGKPFTLSIEVQSGGGYANSVLADKLFSEWLTSFGIKTTEVGLDYATIQTDIQDGNFQIVHNAAGLYNVLGVDPLQFVGSAIGPGYNFIKKGEDGVGFGPVMQVPGIGKIDIPATIQKEATEVGPGKTMDRLVWDWAKFLDHEVPYFDFGNRNYTLEFTTLHYVDWPAQSSPLWKLDAVNTIAGVAAMIEQGYIRPRS